MKNLIYLLSVIMLFSCSENKNKNTPKSPEPPINTSSYNNNPTNLYNSTESYNSATPRSTTNNSNYKYEYRTGSSGNYEYNYDISGSDADGNTIYGNIDITDKFGSGTIQDEYGNEKYIDVEWVDYGILEGVDEDGNYYEFEIDE